MLRQRNETSFAYLLVAPMVLVMTVLVLVPILVTFYYSVREMNLLDPLAQGFVGLKNYKTILSDPMIWKALGNTLLIWGLVNVYTVLISIFFALILEKNTPIKGLLTAVVIIPWVLPPVVNGIIWRWMFHPTFGMVNAFLLRLQLIDDYIPWLTQRFLLLNLASVVVSWRTIPLVAVVLLAALNNIPETLYESAYIDGAGKLGIFSYIKLPLMAPSLVIGFTLATVNSINLFDEIITLSGFAGSTRTVLLEAYVRTFSFLNFGEGSAFIYLVMMLNASICFYCIQRGKRREVQYL